ncbi:anthranilate synthase component 1 [Agreia bicolorata]|uniref:Anthranilate synthase component 1 n=1 Tax=Agreia bicolorata TaxID=110935 RepID=A0A1T4XM15_9MICO|nr:anthranilate synthase component 1 [Agreia bicolorata]
MLRYDVPGDFDLERAYACLIGGRTDSVWLDSGDGARSYFAIGEPVDLAGGVLSALDRELPARRVSPPSDVIHELEFTLGLIGWLGYGVLGETLGMETIPDLRRTDAALLKVVRAVMIDTQGAHLLAIGDEWLAENAQWRHDVLRQLALIEGVGPLAPPPRPRPTTTRWADSPAEYRGKIAACFESIHAGDAFQLCLTTTIEVAGSFDVFDLYRRVRKTSPTHHGALLRIGGVSVVSASPERFLEIDPAGLITTRPIKGTRPRAADSAADDASREELRHSVKEQAENLMIVDLMRNDLSQVCEVGTVGVPGLFEIESYAQVHQLVSTVTGRLTPTATVADVLRACFPAGSMTGAPKRRAISLLQSLEMRARGVYAGAFGYFGFDGSVDLAMTIRTIVVDSHGATVGAGGGITALSNPDAEVEEVAVKAAPLLRALGCIGW